MHQLLCRHVEVEITPGHCLRRRDFLRTISTVAAATGTLSWQDRMSLEAAQLNRRGMACILLWMQGGPSQFETFSPKPGHRNGGETKAIATSVPGIELCEHLPNLAGQMDKFSLVRSFSHRNSSHGHADHYILTGYHPTPAFDSNLKPNNEKPCHGAVISRKLGPRGSVPAYVALPKLHNSGGAAYLGSDAKPFTVAADPNTPNFAVRDPTGPRAGT